MTQVQLDRHTTDSSALFQALDDEQSPFSTIQDYTPVVNMIFNLTADDHNSTAIRVPEQLRSISKRCTDNKYMGDIVTDKNTTEEREVFMKFCPLTDPIEYLARNMTAPELPQFGASSALSTNNAAYVDCLFTKLSTLLGSAYSLPNAITCYGSITGIKKSYICNIEDDVEYLAGSADFNNGVGSRYDDIDSILDKCRGDCSASNRGVITISDEVPMAALEIDCIDGTSPKDVQVIDTTVERISDLSRDSDVSSRESLSDGGSEEEDTSESGSEDDMPFVESKINVGIKDFPVVGVAMEHLEETLDTLLIRNKHPMGQGELAAVLMQIIMSLIAFQKAYDLTHNDLHSSNVMYSRTTLSHLVYKVNGDYYRVPTFGKIWKLIDFGRAIYRFGDWQFCSSSYMEGGDAWSQYNFGPCLCPDKEPVLPNKSFDLCRLGVSLIDLVEWRSMETSDIGRAINEWCEDDNGKNILYKKNGQERYPDFKLYKMIARKVHKHLPENQLKRRVFSRFGVDHKKAKKAAVPSHIIDLDAISPAFKA